MLKGTDKILKNPFSILGLPCNAKKIEIIKAQEKLNKLAKIGAEHTFKTEFANSSWPDIERSAGLIQSSISRIAEPIHKLFWFVNPYYIYNYGTDDVKNELINENDLQFIVYDCFLSNYLYLIIKDTQFGQNEHWGKVFSYIDFVLSCDLSVKQDIFASRFDAFSDREALNTLQVDFSKYILSPIEELTDNSNPSAIIRVLRIMAKKRTAEFEYLRNTLLEQLVNITEKNISEIGDFFESIDDIKKVPKSKIPEAVRNANRLIDIGNSIIEPLQNLISKDSIYIEKIKDEFYTEIMRFCNMFAYSKSFKNAYNCATYAKRYAPVHKMSEIGESLVFFNELKTTAEVVDQVSSEGRLSIKDKYLIDANDFQVSLLAYKAISGNAEAQCTLGNIYKTPLSERKMPIAIPYDVTEGIRWLTNSASNGSAEGQLALGMCYVTGEGVNRDMRIADMWIQEAVAQGNKEAIAIVSDYRYISIKANLANQSYGRTKKPSYAWIWWLLGIILFIIIISNS